MIPTAGSWERLGAEARFRPRFPAVPGTTFAILGRPDADQPWRELARVTAPGPHPVATARVETIEPQGEEVPENLLRVAITFSSPMEEGSAAGRVTLRDEQGDELPGTILDMPPELWDRDRRRLTVLLEPGRIKRGLQPNVQAGPPLRDGETVIVRVEAGIRDAAGAELVAGAERRYRVGPAVRSRVDPTRWRITWPADSGDPVIVRFDRPLDRALVRSCLRVVDGNGRPVPGAESFASAENGWVFTPAAEGVGHGGFTTWSLHVDTRLEDLAGNSVRRVFDRDLERADDVGLDASLVVLHLDGGVDLRR